VNGVVLETERLIIRPFVMDDLLVIHRILDEAFGDGGSADNPAAIAERRSWLQWSVLSAEWFAKMYQPPYGDRAMVLKGTNELIGTVGYVPCLMPFEQLPSLHTGKIATGYRTAEFGLFWAVDRPHRGNGYASEAARAMIQHAFEHLRLARILATTEYDNLASQAVMRKLGMRLERNPLPEPPWMQVVGILDNPAAAMIDL
jgi:RimJ/RimL family protein N-acetyltransferase